MGSGGGPSFFTQSSAQPQQLMAGPGPGQPRVYASCGRAVSPQFDLEPPSAKREHFRQLEVRCPADPCKPGCKRLYSPAEYLLHCFDDGKTICQPVACPLACGGAPIAVDGLTEHLYACTQFAATIQHVLCHSCQAQLPIVHALFHRCQPNGSRLL
jgi:hypothetical protein